MSNAAPLMDVLCKLWATTNVLALSKKARNYDPDYQMMPIRTRRSTMPLWSNAKSIVVERSSDDIKENWQTRTRDKHGQDRKIPVVYVLPVAALQAYIFALAERARVADTSAQSQDWCRRAWVTRASLIKLWTDFMMCLHREGSGLSSAWVHRPLVVWWNLAKRGYRFTMSDFLSFCRTPEGVELMQSRFQLDEPEKEAQYVEENSLRHEIFRVGPLDVR
jgi:hypothetical protein